jgi:succinyl-diaminopimelate desuccinylase
MADRDQAQSLAETTLSLCRIPSVTGEEAAIAEELAARCLHMPGVTVERSGLSVLARRADAPGAPWLALVGHSDTVTPAPPSQQPLGIDAASGRVFGCGASDMKGGLAVMLALLAAPVCFAVNLLCVFYDHEEGPVERSGILPICASGALRDVALALCLEPTDGTVQAGCIGGLQARVTALGRRAHSARPWQGQNAIYAALPLLSQLASLSRREVQVSGLPFYEVTTATQAQTENSRNVVPDRFVLNINQRFAPNRSLAEARAELEALIRACGPYQIEIVDEAPPGRVCLDEPRLRAWIDREGLSVEAKQAWTDVARLTALGIPAVNFGPGETAQAHQANESVPIAALSLAYDRLLHLLGSA